MKFIGNTDEYLQLKSLKEQDCSVFEEVIEGSLAILLVCSWLLFKYFGD